MNAPNIITPSISSSAVFAELSISVWTGRKLDRAATQATTRAAGADEAKSGNFHKKLMGDCDTLAAVQKFAANMRNQHYAMTMPWSDLGLRLLPMPRFAGYMTWVSGAEQEFVRLVNMFLADYDAARTQASVSLGSLYNPDEYPSVDKLSAKFRFMHAQTPVPDAGDFRLDINAEAKAAITQQYENHYTRCLNDAMKDVWTRTHDALSKMAERLHYTTRTEIDEYGREREVGKKIFRDSLVENVHEMIDLLRDFNITQDPKMDEVRVQLMDVMAGVTPDALREDDHFREDTRTRINTVLSSMTW